MNNPSGTRDLHETILVMTSDYQLAERKFAVLRTMLQVCYGIDITGAVPERLPLVVRWGAVEVVDRVGVLWYFAGNCQGRDPPGKATLGDRR